MKINIKEEIHKKYEYLINLAPLAKRKTQLPYVIEVLDTKLIELETLLNSIKNTADKKEIEVMEDRISNLKAAITILIIG